VEPADVAYKKYSEINDHFLTDLEYMLAKKMYPGIATHDKKLVKGAYALIEKYKVPKELYEFQMLYGVTPELRKSIIEKGHRMRVYVPYGSQWFAYSTRRLKENPKMASLIIKALFFRGISSGINGLGFHCFKKFAWHGNCLIMINYLC